MLYSKIDTDQLCNEVQEFLDADHRFFDQDEGVFEFYGERVHYVRLPDEFVLTVGSEIITCVRP